MYTLFIFFRERKHTHAHMHACTWDGTEAGSGAEENGRENLKQAPRPTQRSRQGLHLTPLRS